MKVFDKKYGVGKVVWVSDGGEHLLVSFQPDNHIVGYHSDGREHRSDILPRLVFGDYFSAGIDNLLCKFGLKCLTVLWKMASLFSTKRKKKGTRNVY